MPDYGDGWLASILKVAHSGVYQLALPSHGQVHVIGICVNANESTVGQGVLAKWLLSAKTFCQACATWQQDIQATLHKQM